MFWCITIRPPEGSSLLIIEELSHPRVLESLTTRWFTSLIKPLLNIPNHSPSLEDANSPKWTRMDGDSKFKSYKNDIISPSSTWLCLRGEIPARTSPYLTAFAFGVHTINFWLTLSPCFSDTHPHMPAYTRWLVVGPPGGNEQGSAGWDSSQ